MDNKNLSALVLAGGMGTRMKSDKPKVLHEILGKSLIEHVLLNLKTSGIYDIGVVIGYGAEEVKNKLSDGYSFFFQEKQLGTGHAVMVSEEFLKEKNGKIIIMCADAPLVDSDIISEFVNYNEKTNADCSVLTARLPDPASYGRIIRNGEKLKKIVELKDANEEEQGINEVNSGTYIFDIQKLYKHLKDLSTNNAQNEYYLTDMIEIFNQNKYEVNAYCTDDNDIINAVNNRYELNNCLKLMQKKTNKKHMLSGVTIMGDESVYIDTDVKIGKDTIIYPGTILQNGTIIGNGNTIYSSRINNSIIGNGNTIDNSLIESAKIGDNNQIGPYTHIRPKSDIKNNIRLGNFVEIKNTSIGNDTKVSHLTYIGDGKVGENTNFGCGVVFANYDGENKYLTTIGDNCFIGCNTNLIAPVNVGNNVDIAAGSTINKDIPDNSYAIARAKQEKERENRRKRKK